MSKLFLIAVATTITTSLAATQTFTKYSSSDCSTSSASSTTHVYSFCNVGTVCAATTVVTAGPTTAAGTTVAATTAAATTVATTLAATTIAATTTAGPTTTAGTTTAAPTLPAYIGQQCVTYSPSSSNSVYYYKWLFMCSLPTGATTAAPATTVGTTTAAPATTAAPTTTAAATTAAPTTVAATTATFTAGTTVAATTAAATAAATTAASTPDSYMYAMTYTCSDSDCSSCGTTLQHTMTVSEAAWQSQATSGQCFKWNVNGANEYYKSDAAATLLSVSCSATTTTAAPGQLGAPGTALSGFIAMLLIAMYQLW